MRAAVRSLGPDAKDELGDDAELPLRAEEMPELLVLRAKLQGLARRQDNARRDDRFADMSVLEALDTQPARRHPAGHGREPARRSGGGRQAEDLERRPEVGPSYPRLDPGREVRGVDLEYPGHGREVEGDAVPGGNGASEGRRGDAARIDGDLSLGRKTHGRDYVLFACRVDRDQGRRPEEKRLEELRDPG